MGLWRRLEEIRAPTSGKARKERKVRLASTSLAPRSASKPPGARAEQARRDSATVATNMSTQRPASDHASHAAARELVPPTARSCSLAPSVITPLKRYGFRNKAGWQANFVENAV